MEYEVATKKAKDLLKTVDKNKYPETVRVLNTLVNEWYDGLDEFCWDLMRCDKKFPLEPNVAKLVEKIFLDDIAKNDDYAMCNLGALYYDGRIGEQNFEKAVYYYEMSAKLGNRQAQENLGYCYYYGRVSEPDYKKAYHYFVMGALEGHIVSLYKIGDMYKNGLYVEKNERQAFIIYKHCGDILEGKDKNEKEYYSADIYVRLADCYFYGAGTDKNLEKALSCYQKAEQLYYPRICNGDYMYKKQYERAVERQQLVREEMKKNLPNYSWANKKDF